MSKKEQRQQRESWSAYAIEHTESANDYWQCRMLLCFVHWRWQHTSYSSTSITRSSIVITKAGWKAPG